MGRVLHFLNVYCGLRTAENAIVGPNDVMLGDELVKYTMLDELEVEGLNGWKFKSKFVPIFEFHRADFALCQKKLQRAAILESVVHEAEHNLLELKKKLREPILTKNIWVNTSNPKYAAACAEIAEIRLQIEESKKILEEALAHEFDFYRISREDIGESDCDE